MLEQSSHLQPWTAKHWPLKDFKDLSFVILFFTGPLKHAAEPKPNFPFQTTKVTKKLKHKV